MHLIGERFLPPLCWVFGSEPSRSSTRGDAPPQYSSTAGLSRPIAPSQLGGRWDGAGARSAAVRLFHGTVHPIHGFEGKKAGRPLPCQKMSLARFLSSKAGAYTVDVLSAARGAKKSAGQLSARIFPPTRQQPASGARQTPETR